MAAKRTFRRFRDRSEAEQLVAELSAFDAELWVNNVVVDRLFVGELGEDYHVMLPADRFAEAEHTLEASMEKELEGGVPPDHYLNTFTDEELLDLLMKQEEWSVYDRQLARKLLSERGIVLPAKAVEAMRANRARDLETPAPDQTVWVAIGYVLAFLGGIIGILIGFALNVTKKTLPDGRKVPAYRARDRKNGFYICCIGLVMFVTLMLFRLLW